MMKKILIISLLLIISHAEAAFMIDTMTGYSSSSDSKTSTDINDTTNHIFVAASLGAKQRVFIGQNVTIFSHQIKSSTTNKVSTLELGPRMTFFFTEENVFYGTFAWNPYAKGKRTIGSTEDEISGYSLLAGFGVEVKMNKNFHIGGSINYHSLNVSETVNSSNTATKVSDTYTSLMPMLNLSFRFK